ncbi:DNA-processing protein DprA [Stackebrandtia nassauensis]|uniref:SMF family protein n=1 Tax=Stackebrandtia nassauensis (strain DSM 44728 / CIP 108903 / NRRL B-16338 / NBRC 102104 / LLR-40K-21) TaxID=446470 RepID=D3PV09_STANL|nr:DNA-processing protein DprA [Stackebrandtia nassauensis]ADD45033.1 SMF family protein [Stackebrandtia nassauensis DSM 44728]
MTTTPSDDLLARIALAILEVPNAADSGEPQGVAATDILDRLDAGQPPSGVSRDRVKDRFEGRRVRAVATEQLERSREAGARIIVPGDQEWPPRLGDLARVPDAVVPWCLWLRGPAPLAQTTEQSVAIVGARCCTPYGHTVASELAFQVASSGWAVASGGAYGIDVAAHRAVLAAEAAPTIAVVACGVDQYYPSGHREVFDRIAQTGLIVSQFPVGFAPQRHRFLTRNQVLAALTRGTVVVEAAARSGAKHCLGQAAAMGRYVAGVPGPVTSAYSRGVHQVLRDQHARVVTSGVELLDDLASVVGDASVAD